VLREDPAFMKLANLNTNRFRYFRWTPYTVKFSLMAGLVFPGSLLWLAYETEGKYSLRGKRKGDLIANP
ncbi:hypothetical protein EX30DRAFT_303902, partial [Ascodesmis nigricans]